MSPTTRVTRLTPMRLFAAVVPPEAAVAELADAVTRLHALPGADRLRWTEPAGWHLALAFYGDVAEESLPGLRARLARGADRHPPARLRIAGAGRFARRVLWAGVEGDLTELGRLAETAEASARHAGIPMPAPRPYHPHLTLARNRGRTRLAPYADALAEFTGGPWTATEFSLFHSHLPVEGVPGERPHYETVDTWQLSGGGG
jgi:RNA 2',3'-cyclic 3'-phosphodiesterase